MEVRIGVQHAARELVLESGQTPDEVQALVAAAVADGTVLALTDDRGRTLVVPGSRIAYVEIGPSERGKVGFGAI